MQPRHRRSDHNRQSLFERETSAADIKTKKIFLEGNNMSTAFTGYADPFATSTGSVAYENELNRKFKKRLKKQQKELKRLEKSHEQRLLELERIAEEKRAAEAEQKTEKSLLSKIGDAVVKAIPAVLVAVASFFLKGLFSRKK